MTIDPNNKNAARLVFGAWVLANGDERMPSESAMLDKALESLTKHADCPPWLREHLHFIDGQAGWKCLESEDILAAAQDLQLTEEPNPTYSTVGLKISPDVARVLIHKIKVSEKAAERLGVELRKSFETVQRTG